MSLSKLVSAKYIFIDVVNYTYDRPSEAQIDITSSLNLIVKESIEKNKINTENILFIPTGDGVCIVLKNVSYEFFDAHLKIAVAILEKLYDYNQKTNDKKRQYSIRIGLNENIDNIVIDINGNVNVSGAGINICQRIMDFAGPNQIMVGPQVYEILAKREIYFENFRCFKDISIKNGKISIYQYMNEKMVYVNDESPPQLEKLNKTEQKLPEVTAYYLALLHSQKDKIIKLRSGTGGSNLKYTLIVAFWFLANDFLEKSKESETDQYTPFSPFNSLDELIKCLDEINYRVICEFSGLIERHQNFSQWIDRCTEKDGAVFLNEYGLKKLKEDWPQIFNDICS